MSSESLTILITYSAIVMILVWARFFVYKTNDTSAKKGRYFYDPVATIHIVITYINICSEYKPLLSVVISFIFYLLGISLFLLTLKFSKDFKFALTDHINRLEKSGPYTIIRHPLYVSYAIIWITSTILFNSPFLWITLTWLMAFYIYSAIAEEKAILNSSFSSEYEIYRKNVGMFLPRIRKWIT